MHIVHKKNFALRKFEIARNVIKKILDGSERDFVFDKEDDEPEVLCLIGVNGSGKLPPVQNLVINFIPPVTKFYWEHVILLELQQLSS